MKSRTQIALSVLSASLLCGAAYAADPAPLTYKAANGKAASVLLVTGVGENGSPQVSSYIGPDGKSHSPLVQAQICSVENGTPYLCDAAIASNAALALNAQNAPEAEGAWPTTDPLVAGEAWQDNGVMMLSTGSAAAPTFDGSYLNVTAGGTTAPLGNRLSALINSISNSNSTANKANSNAIAAQTAAAAAQTTADAAIPLSQKGAASGVAALDAKGNMTAPILSNSAGQTGALQVNGQINVQGIGYFVSSMAQIQGIISGQAQKWTLTRRAQDTYTKLNSYNGSSWSAFSFYDDGSITTNLGTVANLGAAAPFTVSVSAPAITATTSASVPDTSTTDSSTAALNTESAAARFETIDATTAALSGYLKSSDAASTYLTITDAAQYATLTQVTSQLSSYAKTSDLNSAVQTLMPIAGGTFAGTVKAPTPAAGDNSTNVATTAFVNTAVQGASGSVVGDISASGSSLSMPVGSSGLTLTMSYVSSGTGSLSIVSTNGTITPVDIYESAVWGGGSVKTYILDSGTVTTTATTVDSTFYLNSNAWGTYHIRAGGLLYVVDVFGSGKGARTTMSWRKIN